MRHIIDIRNIKSYVINIDKNIEKYDEINNRFSKLGIKPERFSGIYAKDLDKDYINNITYPYVQYTMEKGRSIDSDIGSLGAIGCSLSHITLWNMLLNSKEDMFLILEDDAFPYTSINIINNYLNDVNRIDSDWDYIFLGFLKPNIIYSADIEVSNRIYKINEITFQTHAYIINKKGASKLLKNAFPIIHQIDSYISFMAMYRSLNAYRSSNYVVQKNMKGTDIQTDYSIKVHINKFNNYTITFFLILFILLFIFSIYISIKLYYIKS